jgi:hypothetical protein
MVLFLTTFSGDMVLYESHSVIHGRCVDMMMQYAKKVFILRSHFFFTIFARSCLDQFFLFLKCCCCGSE